MLNLRIVVISCALVAIGCESADPSVVDDPNTRAAGETDDGEFVFGGGDGSTGSTGATGDTPGPGACVPDCVGKSCGADGCGGLCGSCGQVFECGPQGLCVPLGCQPDCADKDCGDDGCGGQCGKCAPGEICTGVGQCEGARSGCGEVPASGTCNGNTAQWCENGAIYNKQCNPEQSQVCGWSDAEQRFTCIAGECAPSCFAKQCGDNGCGGSCGSCGPGEACAANGLCDPGCVAQCQGKQCGDNGCGGSCGSCPQGQICGPQSQCQAGSCVPDCGGIDGPIKQCGPDGCGGKCGTCPQGSGCSAAGFCEGGGCSSDCVGKQCGDDGCGGSCGTCPAGEVCGAGFQCTIGQCIPSCVGAGGAPKSCGSDGCGGSCGSCPVGESCTQIGSCQPGACVAQCGGKQCGPDACGGSCGVCPEGSLCNAQAQCADGATGCVPACAGKDCGPDGCGGACGTCAAGLTCLADSTCAAGTSDGEGCGDIDFIGVCEGTTLKYCAQDSLVVAQCSESGLVCGWDADNQWFACLADGACVADCFGKACGSDGCGGSCGACPAGQTCNGTGQCDGGVGCGDVTVEGSCTSDVLTYCTGDTVESTDCGAAGQTCGFDPEVGLFVCQQDDSPPEPGGPCGDVSPAGQCQGDTLVYCLNETLQTFDCTGFGQVCGFDPEFDWFDCIDAPTGCTPDCVNRVCGSDGCGGSCGTCASASTCSATGQCVTSSDCGDVDVNGTCQGNTLVYCLGGSLMQEDCGATQSTCGYDASAGFYDCVAEPACTAQCSGQPQGAPDGCGGTCPGPGCGDLTVQGACEQDVLSYCVSDEIKTVDCAAQNKVCGLDPAFDWYDCIDGAPGCEPDCSNGVGGQKQCGDDGCGGVCGTCTGGTTCTTSGVCEVPQNECGDVTVEGQCTGDLLEYCAGGSLQSADCSALDKVCGWDETYGWYDCIDPQPSP